MVKSFAIRETLSAIALLASFEAAADPVAEFYKNKKISIIIGQSPGGSYDAYARMIGRHMGKHLPGNPSFVSQNMTGAGGRTATAWMYNIAPKDGTVLAMVSQTIPMAQVLHNIGTAQFDARQFHWIGNPFRSNNVLVVWHTTGVKTIEDAKQREVAVGGTGPSSPDTLYPRVTNALFGTKFKVVPGYAGGSEIDLAMERGEVGGRGSNSWQSMKGTAWVAEKKVHVLFQVGPLKEPDLSDVPLLTDRATNNDDRLLLEFISSSLALGRPMLTTPAVPSERVAALRKAFDATMLDADFLREARNQNLDVTPVSGQALQEIVERTTSAPSSVVQHVRELMQIKSNPK